LALNAELLPIPQLPRKYFGRKVFIQTVAETTVEGTIIKYVTGAYVELETELHFELIPWTSIVDMWIVKEKVKGELGEE